jgi:hypothetical protein
VTLIGLAALALLAVTVTLLTRSTPAAHAASASAIRFSHAVVVDQQHPGFEPDVKVAPNGTVFTSVPFGFSTTESFVWNSLDSGNSYQFVPGNIATTGKQSTCFGGGDTDLYVDGKGSLYFSDLQGLTNISNSRSDDGGKTWSTTCAGAPNTPDDRMWFAGTGSHADGNLNLYQDYDVSGGSVSPNGANNTLVETLSHDGASPFQPVVNTSPDSTCIGTSVHDCVTGNEGISGNQVVDPATGHVFIAHTTLENNSSGGTPGVRIAEGAITQGTPPTATWSESPNLDGPLCPNPSCVDSNGNPEEIAGENFATIARDSAGYLYVTFTAGPLDHNSGDANFGALSAPEQIYVVHSLEPATISDPSKVTWSAPQRITGGGASAGTNTFPWITAGSDGRVAVAYYHTNEVSEQGPCASGSGTCTLYGASSLSNAEWSVQMGQSLNAHSSSATYSTSNVSEAYVKQGSICTNGLGCATGGDRSLGDFLEVGIDNQGAAVVSYVFDTSQDTSAGENAGPEVISRQISGPSLLASAGTVSQGAGPGIPMGSAGDPTGDALYSANGTRTPAGDDLDLTGASLANGSGHTLIAKINVKSLSSLAVNPATSGGTDASWILRWTDVVPGTVGNGHIYYAGMDSNGGSGKPSFFVGDTSAIPPPGNQADHTKYITYPQTKKLSSSQASYDSKTGVITMHIPLSDVGNPAYGTVLYSGTAFSATSSSPQSSTTLFNLIDATTPFELVIGPPGTVGSSPTGPPPFSSPNNGGSTLRGHCAKGKGRLTQHGIAKLSLGMKRSKARRTYRRWSARRPQSMDFYCLSPTGIAAGYPSKVLQLGHKMRRALKGRIILLLTANHRYSLHGVHVGARFKRVARRLHAGRPHHWGTSTWYFPPNGASTGVIKVHHGRIVEIGIVNKQISSSARDKHRLMAAYWPYM